MSKLPRFIYLIFILPLLFIAGCVTTIPTQGTHPVQAAEYTLGTGDQIRLIVFGHEDLSGEFMVGSSGTISFPLILDTNVKGHTVEELEQTITEKLSPQYLLDPKVSIEVLQYRDIYILGEVRTPGKYSYIPDLTIQKAAAIAGGYTYRAQQNSAELTRQTNGQITTQDVDSKETILPGDTIIVKRKWF
ncbi:MAG: polysaccharide biosynthesis/export family protein [Alphaproteobacteria bacterium]